MIFPIDSLERPNFIPEEFIYSETACEKNISNEIESLNVIINLNRTADKAQEIRDFLRNPVKINSGFRCLELNEAVGSKNTSQHIKGQAIDFICPDFGTPEKIVKILRENRIEVDQCLMEGAWVHLSIREKGMNRNEFALFLPGPNGVRQKVLLK